MRYAFLLFWLLLVSCQLLQTGLPPAGSQRGYQKAIYANHQEYQKPLLDYYLPMLNNLFGNGMLFGNYKIPLYVSDAARGPITQRVSTTCFLWLFCSEMDVYGKAPATIHSIDARVQSMLIGLYVERELIINGHPLSPRPDVPAEEVPEKTTAPPAPEEKTPAKEVPAPAVPPAGTPGSPARAPAGTTP